MTLIVGGVTPEIVSSGAGLSPLIDVSEHLEGKIESLPAATVLLVVSLSGDVAK